jgi:hypothetical protein
MSGGHVPVLRNVAKLANSAPTWSRSNLVGTTTSTRRTGIRKGSKVITVVFPAPVGNEAKPGSRLTMK